MQTIEIQQHQQLCQCDTATYFISSEDASVARDGNAAVDIDAQLVNESLIVFNASVVNVDQTTLNSTDNIIVHHAASPRDICYSQ